MRRLEHNLADYGRKLQSTTNGDAWKEAVAHETDSNVSSVEVNSGHLFVSYVTCSASCAIEVACLSDELHMKPS